ncbi:MAG: KEOPS complex kinase/ATPase Bud32 [Candidatus Nanosalina sp.]
MKLKGAEATLTIEDSEVIKKREPKEYRDEELDKRLREERTEEELLNLERSIKHGVKAPEPEKIDSSTLRMEKINGMTVKEVLRDQQEVMEKLGKNIGKMHSADVIHGDLTTSNAIWTEEEIFLIDFGLSEVSGRMEDKAVDIHLLKQVLNSSHPDVADEAWKEFVQGYKEYDNSEEVLEQLEDVESRGRYK